MATKVFMEALSPTMEEGRLVKWIKNEGDAVKTGESLAEVETDKAIMELVARGDGVLRKRLVDEGDRAPVGTLVGVIAAADENIDALVAGAGAARGAQRLRRQPAAGRQRPQAKPPAPAPRSGRSESQRERRRRRSSSSGAATARRAPATAPAGAAGAPANGGHVRSSPLARRLASRARARSVGALQGSGPGGRIIKRDIEAAAPAARAAAAAAPRRRRAGARGRLRGRRRSRRSGRRSPSGSPSRSVRSRPSTSPRSSTSRASTEMRAAMAEMGDEFKVSVNDILMKAVATALAQHPEVNAHWLGDQIRQHQPRAPRHGRRDERRPDRAGDLRRRPEAHERDLGARRRSSPKRARERKLKPEEYTGSTFSISNLGMFGIDQFTAIINPPEVGDPRHRRARGQVVVGRRRVRRAQAHARHDELRSPRGRRRRRREVPADAAAADRESADAGVLDGRACVSRAQRIVQFTALPTAL